MAGLRVLLADDDEDDFLIISHAFRELGKPYELHHLINGKELLDYLQASRNSDARPDLVVLDLNMPIVNGFEALEKIRSSSAYAQLPVVMYSTSEEERQRCMALGANAFFTKAYTSARVRALVAEIDLFLSYPYRMPQPQLVSK